MSDEPRDGRPDEGAEPTGPDGAPSSPTGLPDPALGGAAPAPGAFAPDATTTDTPATDVPASADAVADPRVEATDARSGAIDSAPEDARTDGSRTDVSAPWERPQRWVRSSSGTGRVDALLARLGRAPDDGKSDSTEEPDSRRSRRRNNDGDAVPASALIAALGEAGGAAAAAGPVGSSSASAPATAGSEETSGGVSIPATGDETVSSGESVTRGGTLSADTPQDAAVDRPAADDSESAPAAAAAGPVETTAAAGAAPTAAGDAVTEVFPADPGTSNADQAGDGSTDPFPRSGDKAADLAEASSIRAALDRRAGVGSSAVVAAPDAPPPPAAGADGGRKAAAGTVLVHGSSPRRHRGWLYAGRTVAALVAFCTLLGVGVEWKIKDRAEVGLETHAIVGTLPTADPKISTARTTAVVTTNSQGVKTTKPAPPKAVYQPENILLLGSDTRAGGNAAIGGSDDSTAGVANSDTLMVAHISGDREHVTVLSIPRDTIITTPACRAWSLETGKFTEATATVHGGTYSHINTLYAVGGPECTAAGVQSLTGLGITRIIGIDFKGFQAMVDALGGITVNICRPIQDAVLGTVVAKGGVQVIKGAQAISLVRARDVIGDTQSDLARIHRQQVVLSAILRQVTQAGTLLNPGKLDGFLQAFVNNTFTSNVKFDDLVTLAGSLGTLDPARVTFYTLPTVPSTTIDGALDVDKAKAAPVFDDLINDLPLPGEATTSAKPKPTTTAPTTGANLKLTVAPAKVAVELYNVSGRDNVAGMAQQELNAAGFSIDDDQLFKPARTQTATLVQYAPANRAAALTVAAAVPGSTLVVIPGMGNTIHLQLGSSFAGVVRTVAVGQQAPASLSTAISTGPSVTPSTTTSATSSTALSSVNAGAGTCA